MNSNKSLSNLHSRYNSHLSVLKTFFPTDIAILLIQYIQIPEQVLAIYNTLCSSRHTFVSRKVLLNCLEYLPQVTYPLYRKIKFVRYWYKNADTIVFRQHVYHYMCHDDFVCFTINFVYMDEYVHCVKFNRKEMTAIRFEQHLLPSNLFRGIKNSLANK